MWKNLKQILMEQGMVKENDMIKCDAIKKLLDNNDEDYFIYFGLISEEVLCNTLSKTLSIEIVDIKKKRIPQQVIDVVPSWVVFKYSIMPFYLDKDSIYIACGNPIKNEFIQEIRFVMKKKLKVFIALKSDIMWCVNNYYGKSNFSCAISQLQKETSIKKTKNKIYQEEMIVKEAPAVKVVNYIIREAINERASDIHFEPYEGKCRIRYRIDGNMKEIMDIPKSGYGSLCSRVKIMAGINIVENRIPQEGKIYKDIYDFRVSTIPTINGEKIVIRILYKNNYFNSLKEIGFDSDSENLLKEMLKCSQGMLLICGPTGSGKTSTLYAILNYMNRSDINIVTIEDPVEYVLYGINQINVNSNANLTFANGLRSLLRQDPDVIMVGEIRDEETAQIAVRASMTGHMVMSTIHTNDAAGAITRLMDMEVPTYLLADSLTTVISQRLVKKICPFCKEKYYPCQEEIKHYGLPKNFTSCYGKGCIKCGNTGYLGRTICYEMIVMDKESKRIIKQEDGVNMLRKYNYDKGNISIQKKCIELIYKGVTTFEELKRLSLFNT